MTETNGAPLLEVQGVTLRFGGIVALSQVSLDVRAGSIVGVIGPNGAGKSSLLNCISNFYHPQEGRIRFGGVELGSRPPHEIAKLGIARTFQGVEVIREASVLDNVLLGRHVHMRRGLLWGALYFGPSRREEVENRSRAEEALALLEIGRLRHAKVGQLAYGQQKLVSIARAIAMEPRLLLLDEPASGLTFGEKGSIARLVTRLRSVTGLTQVLIEHDVRLIAEVCDYVYVLDFGHVIASGPPEEVLRDPLVVEAYLGKADEKGESLGTPT